MGLRTASLRRPYVAVMAPALTETTQPQALKLPPKLDHHVQPASPLNGFEARGKFLPDVHGSTCFQEVDGAAGAPAVVASGANMSEEQAPQDDVVAAEIAAPTPNADYNIGNSTDNNTGNNNVALAMGQDEKNQQQQGALDVADFPQNVDELMQVIKSMESAEAAVPGSDLIDELPAGLDNLLAGVDMMDMSIEEDTKDDVKENQTKDLIVDLEKRQARLERRLDLMRRKVHKLQVRHMGQHASGEVAGVFEYVHRSLKRLKENESEQQLQQHALPPPLPEEDQAAVGGAGSGGGGGGDNRPRPMTQSSAKALVKKLEMTAMWQANAAARQKHVSRYFGAGSLEPGRCGTVPGVISVPPWPTEHKQELYRVAGLLKAELGVLQREVDSEATDSSSGGESCDEMVNYSNPHQQYLSIQKRALWKFLTARAAIAAKWSWLQAQITDLEYRIRTYTDFHKQIRAAKGMVTLGGASPPRCNGDSSSTTFGSSIGDNNTVYTAASPMTAAINGYKGQLPGGGSNSTFSNKMDIGLSTPSLEISANGVCIDYQCARTRPLVNFRKRKLLQTTGLHLVSKKAARPSTVRCGCVPSAVPCALCTGRTDPTHPRDPTDALSKTERIALVDPTFHPVFSLHEDVSCGIHCDAIMKMPEWQQRSTRMKSMKSLKGGAERSDKAMLDHRSKALDHRKKYGRLKPSTASALSAKIKNKMRGRKPTNRHSSTAASLAYRINRKRSSAKTTVTQMQALVTDGADEEVESIGNSSHAATNSALASPSSSPLFHMQTISGYNRRNRANSYDIDNIVIPYSVAASTRVEKLQYKEILTPKWRIADTDFKCDTKNNGAVRNPSQDSDTEDLSEEAVVVRHDKSEYEEKKKFLSYLKLPAGHRGSRAHKRTDSLAESSGANTPDAMSPHPVDAAQDNAGSPLASPPATPLPGPVVEDLSFSAAVAPAALPSLAVMRRRTISQSRSTRDREVVRDDATATPSEHAAPIAEAVAPFDTRTFPLDEQLYAKMMESMPENSQLKTNDRARDSISDYGLSYLDDKADSPCSESTESAIGEEDPNDPEWVDMERSRDRHKR